VSWGRQRREDFPQVRGPLAAHTPPPGADRVSAKTAEEGPHASETQEITPTRAYAHAREERRNGRSQ
jgi:hypothetical protein